MSAEDFAPLREMAREKHQAKMQRHRANEAAFDATGWTRHTKHHYSRIVKGVRIDYWPGPGKFQVKGKIKHGNPNAYIERLDPSAAHSKTRCPVCDRPFASIKAVEDHAHGAHHITRAEARDMMG